MHFICLQSRILQDCLQCDFPNVSGFPDSSVGKESACNVGDSGSIPGSGRFLGEGLGYPLQYSWTSLAAQLVKSPPAMWKTRVQSLGSEDPLERGKATHSSILAWRICIVLGFAKLSRSHLQSRPIDLVSSERVSCT